MNTTPTCVCQSFLKGITKDSLFAQGYLLHGILLNMKHQFVLVPQR